MSENPPVVYLLHGEDEYAITQFVATLVAKLGDPVMADLNVARLDGRSISLEDLETATHTLPFLVKRRLVVLTNPLARLNSPIARKKFLTQLDHVPPTVALVLIEYRILTEERDRKKGQIQWLEKWALEGGERVYTKAFPLPQGQAMTRRIQEMAKAAGGQISHQAADLLGSLVGENPRAADQEIQKLLAYADYRRTVEVEDVEHLTADQGHGDIFALVDAIGNRDGRKAQNMLHRLLSEQDALSIYGMVVRQFRLLLLAREVMDEGGHANDVMQALKLHPYVVEKISTQARQFSLPDLEILYRRLLDLDEGMKTGELDGNLAFDLLIAGVAQ